MGFTRESAKEAGQKSSRKGKPNKATKELRERVVDLIDENWDRLSGSMEKLSDKEFTDFVMKALEYALPKQRRTETEFTGVSIEQFITLPSEERKKIVMSISKKVNNGS